MLPTVSISNIGSLKFFIISNTIFDCASTDYEEKKVILLPLFKFNS